MAVSGSYKHFLFWKIYFVENGRFLQICTREEAVYEEDSRWGRGKASSKWTSQQRDNVPWKLYNRKNEPCVFASRFFSVSSFDLWLCYVGSVGMTFRVVYPLFLTRARLKRNLWIVLHTMGVFCCLLVCPYILIAAYLICSFADFVKSAKSAKGKP